MPNVTRTIEFLICDEWVFHDQFEDEIDTYRNLLARRGNIESEHMSLSFSDGVMTEISTIRHLGEETVFRTTTNWMKA